MQHWKQKTWLQKKGWKEAKTTESKVRINLLSGVARRHAAKAKVNYR
jgi:hypothetical protein